MENLWKFYQRVDASSIFFRSTIEAFFLLHNKLFAWIIQADYLPLLNELNSIPNKIIERKHKKNTCYLIISAQLQL